MLILCMLSTAFVDMHVDNKRKQRQQARNRERERKSERDKEVLGSIICLLAHRRRCRYWRKRLLLLLSLPFAQVCGAHARSIHCEKGSCDNISVAICGNAHVGLVWFGSEHHWKHAHARACRSGGDARAHGIYFTWNA